MTKRSWLLLAKSIAGCAIGSVVSVFLLLEWEHWLLNSYMPWSERLEVLLHPDWQGVLILAGIGLLLMIVLGLPAQYMLQKRNLTGLLWPNVLAIAVITAIIGLLMLPSGEFVFSWLFARIYVAACLAASMFWLIRRPDEDSKQETPPPSVSA